MTDHTYDTLMLMALLDAIPDAVLMSDAGGTITRANPAAGLLFGYDPAHLLGKSVNMLMPEALSDRHDGFMQGYLDTGQARIIGQGRAVEGLRNTGETFPLHLSIGRADYDGADYDGAVHFVAILHDLTKRVAAEEALARSARLDAIGQMTSGISHDFSNILTVVIGNIELLQARIPDAETQAMLGDALEAAELGAKLTAGLTAFVGKAPRQAKALDVNTACQAALGLIERTFDAHYDIRANLAQDLPKVGVDATQLQSALINIALNARDAMPDGGTLSLRTEKMHIDDDYVAQELDMAHGDYVRLSVTDTGRGMAPDARHRALEPFFTTKPIGQGTGLGLAMVYGFVRQSGGHITIYSEIGRGTTISLYFPVLNIETHATRPARPFFSGARGNDQTILVVEDNHQLRKLTAARLKHLGYRVQEAETGDQAAALLQQTDGIDAVFTDLVMPGELDGLALARHIVASYPHIRILMSTGYADDLLARSSNNEHSHRILHKPYRQSDLAAALEALFDNGRSVQDVTEQVNE